MMITTGFWIRTLSRYDKSALPRKCFFFPQTVTKCHFSVEAHVNSLALQWFLWFVALQLFLCSICNFAMISTICNFAIMYFYVRFVTFRRFLLFVTLQLFQCSISNFAIMYIFLCSICNFAMISTICNFVRKPPIRFTIDRWIWGGPSVAQMKE
jgi:hypothetical protein